MFWPLPDFLLSKIIVLVLYFYFLLRSYSAHLPGVWQSVTTGPGKAVMGTAFCCPQPGSPAAAPIA